MSTPDLFSWYYYIIIAGCFIFCFLSITNTLYLSLFTKKPRLTHGPLVSVLVPARDEEQNIGRCLDSLLNQTYRDYEIIVYDDMSEDGTWEIISGYAEKNPSIRAIKGSDLPEGWFGKPHAMQELARHASGEYFLFTDADTVHDGNSISWAVTNALAHRADALSGYTRQIPKSFGEVAVLSNMFLNAVLFMPLWIIPLIRLPFASHIIGQFIFFKASVFKAIDGYKSVRHKISEDIYIGRELKKRGHRLVFLDVKNHVSCRMYRSFSGAVDGIAKNIYDFFEKHVASIIALTVFIIGGLVLPVVLLPLEVLTHGSHIHLAAASVGLFFGAWALFLYNRGMVWYAPLLYPFLFILLIYIGWKSVIDDTLGKGYLWKGRFVK
ncbi:MAG TPA: glycosyltransferase [Chitinivibrionales bacterium]|nr:glycosyltransferase [Chitinivibrionales bacterium]